MSAKLDPTTTALQERITNYLASGGLFNPEAMEHDKVRDLLIDCREGFNAGYLAGHVDGVRWERNRRRRVRRRRGK